MIFSALNVPLRSDADLICLDRLIVIGVVYCGLAVVTGLPSSVKRATAPGAGVITRDGRVTYVPEFRLKVGGSTALAGAEKINPRLDARIAEHRPFFGRLKNKFVQVLPKGALLVIALPEGGENSRHRVA